MEPPALKENGLAQAKPFLLLGANGQFFIVPTNRPKRKLSN